MNPKIIYPIPKRQSSLYLKLRNIFRIVFLIASIVCVAVNIITADKAWSVVVLWSLYGLWQFAFSFKLVEFSFYSLFIRVIIFCAVLLVLIDKFLISGWASLVVPIVLFSGLLIMFIYYLVTYNKKERHLMSIFVLGLLSIIQIPFYNHTWPIENWLAFAFQIGIFVLFIILVISNWKDILFEIKARFMTKV